MGRVAKEYASAMLTWQELGCVEIGETDFLCDLSEGLARCLLRQQDLVHKLFLPCASSRVWTAIWFSTASCVLQTSEDATRLGSLKPAARVI